MLWVYAHYKYIYSYSEGINFRRQNLTSTRRQILTSEVDPRAVRVKLATCSFYFQSGNRDPIIILKIYILKFSVVFDPTVMYGHSENDFTILFMEKDFPETFYEEYRKSFHSRPPDDSASKLVYLLSASLLLYLYCPSVDPDVMQQEALKNGKELLNMLKC